jgi:hypothetical protein
MSCDEHVRQRDLFGQGDTVQISVEELKEFMEFWDLFDPDTQRRPPASPTRFVRSTKGPRPGFVGKKRAREDQE